MAPTAAEAPEAPPSPGLGLGFAPLQSGSADRIVLRQIYNWNDFKFVDDPVNGHNRLPGIPRAPLPGRARLRASLGLLRRSQCPVGDHEISRRLRQHSVRPPYAVFGIRGGYQAESGWSGFLEVRNLANKRYASAVDVIPDARTSFGPPRVFRPGEGRGFYGGVQVRW